MVDYGVRMGGGIADVMKILQSSDIHFFSRFVFDITFFMLINFICLNVIFGIIIDTFAQLRDELKDKY